MERDLPEGWVWKRLGEIAEINARFKKNSIDDDTEVTFLPMRCVEELTGTMDTSIEKKYGEIKTGYTPIQEGDLLFAKITPCIENGKIAIAKNLKNGIGFASTEFHTLKISPENDTKFYFFYLMQEKIRQEAARNMTGTAGQQRVPVTFLKRLVVPVPQLSIQRKIVSMLEHGEGLKRVREEGDSLTAELLQSIFQEMFGDLIKNERMWEIKKLKDIVTIEKCIVNPDESNGHNKKIIGLENIEKATGQIVGSSNSTTDEIKSAKFQFTKDNILYGKLRPYLNKVALPDFDGLCSTDILTLKPIPRMATKEFLVHILRKNYFVKYAAERSVGANLPRVSPKTILEFETTVPPIALQRQFSHICLYFEQIRRQQLESKRGINELFEGLVASAFSGDLV